MMYYQRVTILDNSITGIARMGTLVSGQEYNSLQLHRNLEQSADWPLWPVGDFFLWIRWSPKFTQKHMNSDIIFLVMLFYGILRRFKLKLIENVQ